MAKLQIDVHGCGYSSQCLSIFTSYKGFVRGWGYSEDQVEMSYQVEPGRDTPLIIASVDGKESRRWGKIPSPQNLKDYLKSQVGKPDVEPKSAKRRSGVGRVPMPWGRRAAML